MDFIINEAQLRAILKEEDEKKMTSYMKRLNSFTKEVMNRVQKSYGLNLRMLLTWGTSVGGLILPLNNYIITHDFKLTDDERYLIIAGVASIIFFESKKSTKELVKKIQENGLTKPFQKVLNKGIELEDAFSQFLLSINVSIGSVLDTVAYSFLIPIITDIEFLVAGRSNVREITTAIAERLLASGVVLMSASTLTSLIRKLIKKFR